MDFTRKWYLVSLLRVDVIEVQAARQKFCGMLYPLPSLK